MFKIFLVFAFCCAVNARNIPLSQKELQSVGSILKAALSHHLDKNQGFKITGTFSLEENVENPDDYDFTIDVDVNDTDTHNGVLSGNDVLNGLANGNGNDNGHNGNVFLQIFNGPVDGSFVGKPGSEVTTAETTTSEWWTTRKSVAVTDEPVVY